jgi:RNA polymerase sigma-70 factor (ECF subfamily)
LRDSADTPDAILLQRAREGDGTAFQELFERHMSLIRAKIRHRLPPAVRRKVSASDVVQEARIVAMRRLSEFEDRGPGSFGAWIHRIVELKLHEAVRHFRGPAKRHVGREVGEGSVTRARQIAAPDPTPSQVLMHAEEQEAARRALAALPEDYRTILVLTREKGLTLREAAGRMGRTLDAARKLSARALRRFAVLLQSEGGGEARGKRPKSR